MSIRLRLAAVLLVVSINAGCVFDRAYEVEGRIVGFGSDSRTVLITHGDIPGFMPAMTMAFSAADTVALDAYAVGDEVRFTLAVSPKRSVIYGLRRLPPGSLTDLQVDTPEALVPNAGGSLLLSIGDPAPAFSLIDQNGTAVTRDTWAGKSLLLTFIYTRCPLPDYCPLLSRRFRTLQPRILERFGEQVQLLSISIDPTYDTPDVLRAYAHRYTNDTQHWTFATGTEERIRALAEAYGVYYERDQQNPQALVHNLSTALVAADGQVHAIWRGSEWEPEDVLYALDELRNTDRL